VTSPVPGSGQEVVPGVHREECFPTIRVIDPNRAGAADAAVLPPSGHLGWRLTIDNG
jgi:hypothetical protein